MVSFFVQVYEPVEEGSYIKMIDMVSGYGGQIHVNPISIVILCLPYLFCPFHLFDNSSQSFSPEFETKCLQWAASS